MYIFPPSALHSRFATDFYTYLIYNTYRAVAQFPVGLFYNRCSYVAMNVNQDADV